MAEHEGIVFAFRRIGEPRYLSETGFVRIRPRAAGEHLVHIALMRHVEHETIMRGIEHMVHGDGEFDHAEIRTDVTSMQMTVGKQGLADLPAEIVKLPVGEGMHIRRGMYRIQYASGHRAWNPFLLSPATAKSYLTVCP